MPNKKSPIKSQWIQIKSNLPKNWCQQVSNSLASKGFQLSPTAVSDVKNGRIKNLATQEIVWKEIKKMSKRRNAKMHAIKSIIHS